MKLLDDLLSTLDMNAGIRDIRQGVFHTGVLSRNCGLAATLPQDALKQHREGDPLVKNPGNLQDAGIENQARLACSDSLLEASIGMAAINSLLEVDTDRCLKLNAAELLLEKGKGKKIAIIGHFPFIPRLQEEAEKVWVIEKNRQQGDLSEDQSAIYLPQADVIGITGTAITNHTIEGLLEMCNPQAYLTILGDSAPLSPLLFEYGIDAISGTKVIDPETALRCVSQGATYRQVKGILKLIMLKEK